jgi:large subunit ribosomal protein LP0
MPKEEVQKEYSARKQEFAARLYKLLADNKNVLIISADNVGSQSMHMVRAELRKGPRATILMGKNTMVKYVIKKYANDTGNQTFNKLAELCKLNVGLVFTNDDMKDVRDTLEKNKVTSSLLLPADLNMSIEENSISSDFNILIHIP